MDDWLFMSSPWPVLALCALYYYIVRYAGILNLFLLHCALYYYIIHYAGIFHLSIFSFSFFIFHFFLHCALYYYYIVR